MAKRKVATKRKPKTIAKKNAVCPNTFNEFVQTRAYYLWEQDGFFHGNDVNNWNQAKKEISKKYSVK